MIALDTNVLVRFIADDEPDMRESVLKLLQSQSVFVALTVTLETDWVIRTAYGFEKAKRIEVLKALLALPGLVVQEEDAVRLALEWCEAGLDFADALHLALSLECSAFASFDQRLISRSARLNHAIPVIHPNQTRS